jgi:hypothetical protein
MEECDVARRRCMIPDNTEEREKLDTLPTETVLATHGRDIDANFFDIPNLCAQGSQPQRYERGNEIR